MAWDRRHFLTHMAWVTAGAAAVPLVGRSMAVGAAEASVSPLARAACDAWLFGLPLIEMAKSRAGMLQQAGPNKLIHARRLTTPERQPVTTPNNDTLYSFCWMNLQQGPVRVTLPKTGERYFSAAFMDMYSNNFAILGSRTTGGDGGTFTLVGPQAASDDPMAIRAPTNWVWMLGRLLVEDEADLPSAHALQDQMRVEGPAAALPREVTATRQSGWASYFAAVQQLMAESPPRVTDDALLDRIAPLGLWGAAFDSSRFGKEEAGEIQRGIALALSLMRGRSFGGPMVNGWSYPKAQMGDYGQDYLLRAQVAVGGLAALPRVEAMYMRPVNADGSMVFDAGRDWVLHFPKEQMPAVDAFWSLSMYRATDDGQFYFFDNAIQRYAIGDRTKGLRYGADGSLTLWLSRADPGEDRRSNWLPLPQEPKFAAFFRGYLPQPAMLDGRYVLPPLVPA